MKTVVKTAAAFTFAITLGTAALSAQNIIDNTDVDIAFHHDSGGGDWSVFFFDTQTEAVFSTSDTYLRMNENSMRTRPSGSAFDFIGPAGSTIWYLPEADPGAPYDSLYGAHQVEVDPGVLLNNEAILTFPGSVRPEDGHFHLWFEDAFGNPTLYFSSDPSAGAPNSYTFPDLTDEDHIHFNWAFTAPGLYEIDMRLEAELAAGGATAAQDTITFQVIPEPSTCALFAGLGVIGLIALRRRAQR